MQAIRAVVWTLMVGAAALAVTQQAVAAPEAKPVPGAGTGASLEKGYYQEKTAGDLDAAIAIYQQVAADPESSKAEAAEATYRVGLCQLKKGSDQARQSFQKVVDEFPGQPAARKARQELQKLDAQQDGDPVVLSTTPTAFDDDVPADLKEITATFSQSLLDGNWSWTGGGETFPKTIGKPHYNADRTTCTLSVRLEPGQVYWVGINSPSYQNFATPSGRPVKRYVILFATRSADGQPTPIPQDLLEQARQINQASTQTSESASQPLQIGPAPWVDGERMSLRVAMPTGMEIGTLKYTARTVEDGGRSAWKIEANQAITMANQLQYTRVDAERESFRPIRGVTRNTMGEFTADYTAQNVSLKIRGADGREKTQQVPVQGPVFDNEQTLYLIRRLPLAEAYSTKFMIFTVQGASIVECDIDVLGKDTVSVPAGTFDCYKVKLSIKSGQMVALTHTLWFSADEHKYLVKYDASQAVMELVSAAVRKDEQTTWKNEATSFRVPAGWDVYEQATPMSGEKMTVQILPPGQQAWAVFIMATPEMPPGVDTPRKVAEADIGTLKGYFKNYVVREASWKESTIGGLPAASYVADYTDKGKDMVEYRTYLLGKQVYWFVFRIEKDDFEGLRPQMDEVIQSLQAQ
ncbi:MAG: DUF3108 domain-containing protein [Phycisphaeraceae bacterium]|nr:DUF3108 domain-containing protein [Phycisphaeraceae bacterium]